MDINNVYFESIKKQFLYYKTIGEKAIEQLESNQLLITENEESNAIANIIKHLSGNMLSRWTDFLTSDGEKDWRNRDVTRNLSATRNVEKTKMKIKLLLLLPMFTFAQVNLPTVPQPTQMTNYSNQNYSNPNNRNIAPSSPNQYFNNDLDKQRQQKQHDQIMREVEQNEKLRIETLSQVQQDINELNYYNQFNLPSLANKKGTEYYRNVYDKMLNLNIEDYSIKDVNFQIENAYLENKEDKAEFDKIIKQSGEFIITKMKELNYDTNSNSAKKLYAF